jgi:hypothetical protein
MILVVCEHLGFENLFIGYISHHSHLMFEAGMLVTWEFDHNFQVALASMAKINFKPDMDYT